MATNKRIEATLALNDQMSSGLKKLEQTATSSIKAINASLRTFNRTLTALSNNKIFKTGLTMKIDKRQFNSLSKEQLKFLTAQVGLLRQTQVTEQKKIVAKSKQVTKEQRLTTIMQRQRKINIDNARLQGLTLRNTINRAKNEERIARAKRDQRGTNIGSGAGGGLTSKPVLGKSLFGFKLQGPDSRAAAAMRDFAGSTGVAGSQAQYLGSMLARLGPMAVPLGVLAVGMFGLVKAISAATEVGKEFEYTMARVAAISGEEVNSKAMASLAEQAKHLGDITKFTANEVAEGFFAMSQLGFDTSEITAISENVADIAAAANVPIREASEQVGVAMQQFNLRSNDMVEMAQNSQRVVDVMAHSFNNSALNLERWTNAMKYAGSVAGATGVDLETTAALMGTIADQGIIGSRAGTGMRRMFLALGDASSKANKAIKGTLESADFKKYADESLQGVSEFTRKLAAIKFKYGNSESLVPKLKEFFTLYATPAAIASVKNLDNLIKKEREVRTEAEGSAKAMREKTMATLKGLEQRIKSRTQSALLGLFDAISPALTEFSERLLNSIEAFANMIGENKESIAATANAVMELADGAYRFFITIAQGTIGLFKGAAAVITGFVGTALGVFEDMINFIKKVTNLGTETLFGKKLFNEAEFKAGGDILKATSYELGKESAKSFGDAWNTFSTTSGQEQRFASKDQNKRLKKELSDRKQVELAMQKAYGNTAEARALIAEAMAGDEAAMKTLEAAVEESDKKAQAAAKRMLGYIRAAKASIKALAVETDKMTGKSSFQEGGDIFSYEKSIAAAKYEKQVAKIAKTFQHIKSITLRNQAAKGLIEFKDAAYELADANAHKYINKISDDLENSALSAEKFVSKLNGTEASKTEGTLAGITQKINELSTKYINLGENEDKVSKHIVNNTNAQIEALRKARDFVKMYGVSRAEMASAEEAADKKADGTRKKNRDLAGTLGSTADHPDVKRAKAIAEAMVAFQAEQDQLERDGWTSQHERERIALINHKEDMKNIELQHNQDLLNETDRIFNVRLAYWEAAGKGVQGFGALAETQASKSKEMAYVYKALAITEATIATYVGATKTYAALAANPPLAAFAAAGVVASGLANVLKIKEQKFAGGGIVQGPGAGDRTQVWANGGEMILNRSQQATLFNNMSGGSRGQQSSSRGDVVIEHISINSDTGNNAGMREDIVDNVRSALWELNERGELTL